MAQVEAGEEVVITRQGEPVAQLVRYKRLGMRQSGTLEGRIVVDDSILDPLLEDELKLWEGG